MRTRTQWRAWLGKHHTSSRGVWLIFHQAHTGVKTMPYEYFVREALSFGWIDSLVERLDVDRFASKVTPRRGTSRRSDINRRRWTELKRAGLHRETRLWSSGLPSRPQQRKRGHSD